MPSPVGDRFFDHWPADLAGRKPGDLIATRDVTPVAGFLVTVPLRSARQVKFRTTDATGGPLFGTATLFDSRGPFGSGMTTAVANPAAQIDFSAQNFQPGSINYE